MNAALLAALVLAAEPPGGLTVSGGVSLGTWESGYLYFHAQANKMLPTSQLRIATGTSAGSANALIAVISACRGAEALPMSSLEWNVWGPVGLQQLFDRKRATSDALFVRDELERSFERVREVWNQGLPEDCDVVWGASVTRVKPRQVAIKPGLSVPRVLDTFMVRIEGRGPGRPPRLSNYISRRATSPVPLLPFADDEDDPAADARNFSLLRSVLYASSAFPIAFAPTPIEYCLSRPQAPPEEALACPRAEFVDLFIDGGVFDNNPLRVAWAVANTRLLANEDGSSRWESPFTTDAAEPRTDTRFLYLDPDTTSFPPEDIPPDDAPAQGFIDKLFSIAGGLITSARSTELSALSRQPDLAERLDLGVGNLPRASDPLEAFAGFFETEFRRFDFYLGMHDAFVQLTQTPAWREQPVDFERILSLGDDVRAEWAPFLCLLSMTQPDYASHRSACEGPRQQDFRILLQVSLDRLAETCRTGTVAPVGTSTLCADARLGGDAPQVPQVTPLPSQVRRRAAGESGFDHFMRLLGEYGFEFKDLGLPRARAKDGKLALRRALDPIVDVWANSQPTLTDRLLSRTAARVGLNTIEFSPALFSLYAVLGTLVELGGNFAPFPRDARWLQLHGALTLGQLFSLFTDARPRFSVNLTTGPEAHLSFLSNAIVQPRLAVRGGVQLGVVDGFASQPCLAAPEVTDKRGCTQPLLEAVLAVSLFERLRLELVWQTYPMLYGARAGAWSHVHFGVGVHFY